MGTRSSRLVGAQTMQEVFAAKAKILPDDAKEIALRVLIALDAAKRSRCSPGLANFLTNHIVMAVAIGSQMRNKTFLNMCTAAYSALFKACQRDTVDLDLTTGEYATIRRAVAYYVNHLPHVEVGLLNFAAEHAARVLTPPGG
ncbi:MAG: hypothetical protein V4724_26695 [Pseudomonadota bacterium]